MTSSSTLSPVEWLNDLNSINPKHHLLFQITRTSVGIRKQTPSISTARSINDLASVRWSDASPTRPWSRSAVTQRRCSPAVPQAIPTTRRATPTAALGWVVCHHPPPTITGTTMATTTTTSRSSSRLRTQTQHRCGTTAAASQRTPVNRPIRVQRAQPRWRANKSATLWPQI